MLEQETSGASAPEPRCMWCSAVLPSVHETVCPTCGATLVGEGDTAAVPGLTAIDAEAILRNARTTKAKPRGRLMSWISGEYDEDAGAGAAPPGSLAPPSADVRREMLRLELEAQVANAQAEVEAMAADAAVEEGRPIVAGAATPASGTDAGSDSRPTDVAAATDAAEPVDEAPPA